MYNHNHRATMSDCINHPIHAISRRKSKKDAAIDMTDYHHFDNLRRYLDDLPLQFPNCVTRTGKKAVLKCDCCSVFRIPQVTCAVAAYLMHFGKAEKLYKQLMVVEWIKAAKEKDEDTNGNLPYRLPYLAFSDYDDMLREEGILSFDIPLDILQTRYVCKTTMMNVIGVGIKWWNTCQAIIVNGPKPSGLEGNDNASKSHMTDTLDIFFTTIKELSEPVATLVVRKKTETTTKMSLKQDEIGTYYLPPFLSKRRLYERYCFESGHVAKRNSFDKYVFEDRNDPEWKEDEDIIMEVFSWWKFLNHWKKHHGYLRIRKPAKDICQQCFLFSNHHKYRIRSEEANDDDDEDSESTDDEDNNQYDDMIMATGIVRLSDDDIKKRENCVMDAAEHVSDARNMREYANEKIALCKATNNLQREDKVVTLVCDYSQNGEIPSFGSEQPGEVYYFSPLTIFIFGIVDTNDVSDKLTTYCYDEGVGRKGGNNVASLLMKHLRDSYGLSSQHPMKELNIVMDNCAGQNKNKMVLRLAAYLVESNYFKKVSFIFYVVGHTKNPADRLFNLAKGAIRQQNVYTMDQFLACMNSSEYVTAIEVHDIHFFDYNEFLDRLYKDLTKPGVKRWQIFEVEKELPGQELSMVFKTSNRPDAAFMTFPIKKKTTTNREEKLTAQLNQLDAPGRKDIKQVELYTKFRKFVPEDYQEECCPKPSDEILDRFKIEKTEKIKLHKQKKVEETHRRIQNIAERAAGMAIVRESTVRAMAVAAAIVDDGRVRKVRKRSKNNVVEEE